jgi:hypothetical protein
MNGPSTDIGFDQALAEDRFGSFTPILAFSGMSAYRPIATEQQTCRKVRFVPQGDIARWWPSETEGA